MFNNSINNKTNFDLIQTSYELPNGEIDQNLILSSAVNLLI